MDVLGVQVKFKAQIDAKAEAAPAAPVVTKAEEAPAAPAPVKAETTPIEVVAEPEPEAPAAETKSRNSGMADESARYGESLLREMLGAEPMQDKNGK
jgi:DNA polymerase-3 subunit gamma/tau